MINIQALGRLLNAAAESGEMSQSDNIMASYLVSNYGEAAQNIIMLKGNAEYFLKQKHGGKSHE